MQLHYIILLDNWLSIANSRETIVRYNVPQQNTDPRPWILNIPCVFLNITAMSPSPSCFGIHAQIYKWLEKSPISIMIPKLFTLVQQPRLLNLQGIWTLYEAYLWVLSPTSTPWKPCYLLRKNFMHSDIQISWESFINCIDARESVSLTILMLEKVFHWLYWC